MENISLNLDQDTARNYSNALQRVLNGEDIKDGSSDLAFIVGNLKEEIDASLPEEELSEDLTPNQFADNLLGVRHKIKKETLLQELLETQSKERKKEYYKEVVNIFAEKNPHMFIESSGGKVGDLTGA